MGPGFLIDTNAAIDFIDEIPPESLTWLAHQFNARRSLVSVITRIELLACRDTPSEMSRIGEFLAGSRVFPLNEPVIPETIRFRQLYKRKLPDAIIAATASVYDLTVLTHNGADFAHIAGLRVLNPHEPTTLPPL